MKQIFISSVQKEFEFERAAIKKMIESDPILRPYFKAFVFEIDAPAADKTTQQVYLGEIERSDIYLVLVGDKYGYCMGDEPSPTEQEYDEAQRRGLTTLVFVRGKDNSRREPRETAFLNKISDGRVRVRYQNGTSEYPMGDLLDEVRSSIRDIMIDDGVLSELPFEDQVPADVSMGDISEERIRWFVKESIRRRTSEFKESDTREDVLRGLHMLDRKRHLPTKAAVLLFGTDPQYFFPTSCIKCASYFGTEKRKPSEDLAMYDGDLFRLSDQAVAFVNRHTFHGAGVHANGSAAEDQDEIPTDVISEAINNAIAHRNYASMGSIQVEVYQNRIEVISPGRLHQPLTIDELYQKHESVAPNPHIARGMFWPKYIETVGSGLTDLFEACEKVGLRRPLLEELAGSFKITIWRREQAVANKPQLTTNKPQISVEESVLNLARSMTSITRNDIREICKIDDNTARNLLRSLINRGILVREGEKRAAHYRLAR